ncbi:MAG: porin [Betaproteobacteria bacterium]|nr:porin [Betaproteobacteria bacterium]MDE2622350.1 porin [Betaproteobacteria bacterium]
MIRRIKLRPAALAVALGASISLPLTAHAQSGNPQDIESLKEQIRVLMNKVDTLSKKQASQQKQIEATSTGSSSSEPKLNKLLSGFYGVLDLSVDDTTKGMGGMTASPYSWSPATGWSGPQGIKMGNCNQNTYAQASPCGRMGWMPQVATNKSGFGYRGDHLIEGTNTKFIYQFGATVAITSTPGVKTSYTAQKSSISGALGTGDNYIGLRQGSWGAIKIGKTFAPYKKASDRMDPMSGLLGSRGSIMGNSGGDNRVEFGTRLDHAIWYESPNMKGYHFNFLFAPGQNRSYDNVIQPSGSGDCAGGNVPGSGNLPMNCDDGGFSDAMSTAFSYESKKFYAFGAYEIHKAVNRNSDGIGANNQTGYYYGAGGTSGPIGAPSGWLDMTPYNFQPSNGGLNVPIGAYTQDIANEWAGKVGAQYITDFGLTISAELERLRRDVPAYLQFQNERSRDGSWLALSQRIDAKNEVDFAWGHAGKTPGDPGGQHNYSPYMTDNTADMYSLAYKHKLDKHLSWYLNVAETVNHGNAHYDLGAGGHGLKTDCHDATNTPVTDYSSAGNTTWGGCHIQGISAGLHYRF